jgi:hypothetical protein
MFDYSKVSDEELVAAIMVNDARVTGDASAAAFDLLAAVADEADRRFGLCSLDRTADVITGAHMSIEDMIDWALTNPAEVIEVLKGSML